MPAEACPAEAATPAETVSVSAGLPAVRHGELQREPGEAERVIGARRAAATVTDEGVRPAVRGDRSCGQQVADPGRVHELDVKHRLADRGPAQPGGQPDDLWPARHRDADRRYRRIALAVPRRAGPAACAGMTRGRGRAVERDQRGQVAAGQAERRPDRGGRGDDAVRGGDVGYLAEREAVPTTAS